MIWNCPVCGKAFDVLWPHLWAYKRNSEYICSWKCLRAMEQPTKRSEDDMARGETRLGKTQNEEAVRLALEGGNPLKYLEDCGSKNPSAAWYNIKQKVKERDPETYAKLPKKIQRKDAVQKDPELKEEEPLPVKELKLEPGGNYKISVEEPKEPKPLQPAEYKNMLIREVEGLFGRYRRTDVGDKTYIDFENEDKLDTLSLTADAWKCFRQEQERAFRILGVEL